MQTSSEIKNIAAALVSFHKEVGKIGKDAKNPFYKSKYASLSAILEAIDEPLHNNGLALLQFPEGDNGLTTRLVHTSGEWMEATYSMKPVKDTPQDRGSSITYQRRYAVGAILSLNIDEDDDGNAASQPGKKQEAKELDYRWAEGIDACNTQKELVEYYNKHRKDVDADPRLQKMLAERRNMINGKILSAAQ